MTLQEGRRTPALRSVPLATVWPNSRLCATVAQFPRLCPVPRASKVEVEKQKHLRQAKKYHLKLLPRNQRKKALVRMYFDLFDVDGAGYIDRTEFQVRRGARRGRAREGEGARMCGRDGTDGPE